MQVLCIMSIKTKDDQEIGNINKNSFKENKNRKGINVIIRYKPNKIKSILNRDLENDV